MIEREILLYFFIEADEDLGVVKGSVALAGVKSESFDNAVQIVMAVLRVETAGEADGAEVTGREGDVVSEEFVFEKTVIEADVVGGEYAVFKDFENVFLDLAESGSVFKVLRYNSCQHGYFGWKVRLRVYKGVEGFCDFVVLYAEDADFDYAVIE